MSDKDASRTKPLEALSLVKDADRALYLAKDHGPAPVFKNASFLGPGIPIYIENLKSRYFKLNRKGEFEIRMKIRNQVKYIIKNCTNCNLHCLHIIFALLHI